MRYNENISTQGQSGEELGKSPASQLIGEMNIKNQQKI
jgi:hypothetical protein